ncbi:MAG: hypothetical protein K2Y23_06675 [Cyanobacteria bacterium]|nr:hypothetical protein [Cyanobacteriota bacterium]
MTQSGDASVGNSGISEPGCPIKSADDASLIGRIRGEYIEMPGLALTEAQLCRLSGLDTASGKRILETLTTQHFLVRTEQGIYVRASNRV